MKLLWSAYALADRDEIFDYIQADNPRAAVAVNDLIRRNIELLIRFPDSGRAGRVEDTRELPIRQTPYIAAYRVLDDPVLILRIIHGARQWPEDMPDQSHRPPNPAKMARPASSCRTAAGPPSAAAFATWRGRR